MRWPRLGACRRLVKDARGATIVEFALVIGPLCAVTMAACDLAYSAYVSSMVQGTLIQASRLAAVGGVSSVELDAFVTKRMAPVAKLKPSYTRVSYADYSRVGQPEKILKDTAPLGTYNLGDCWEDANGNGVYDKQGGRAGAGGSEDVVYYTIEIQVPRILPLDRMFGWSASDIVKGTTLLRTQPYGKRATFTCT